MKQNTLVIAHPDDECMFFTPLLSHIDHIICLSNGDFDKLGRIREKEFMSSCKVLNKTCSIGTLQDGQDWSINDVLDSIKSLVLHNDVEVYTFDGYGVSGHKNHIAIYTALLNSTYTVYALVSVPLYRKYVGLFDLLLTIILSLFSTNPIYISNFNQALLGYKSMLCHRSQLVWFRYLYLLSSRYMWINEFIKIN